MKILMLLIATIVVSATTEAQSPQGFNYQAAIRNSSGALVKNQVVGLKFRILRGAMPVNAVYTEYFSKTSSDQGLITVELGKGSTMDNFSSIDWSDGPYHLETSVDITGGSTYTVVSVSQFLSVPYALHAEIAETAINDAVDDADADPENELQNLELMNDSLRVTKNPNATAIDLSKYLDDTRHSEHEIDSLVENNGYAKLRDGVYESEFNGTFTNGVGNGDSAIIGTIPSHTTWHFDFILTAHDVNSNTNQRNVHREFIVYRNWTLDATVQNLVTHYDATSGAGIDVIIGTDLNQNIYYKLKQSSGGSTDIVYRVLVRMTKAN